MKNEDFVTYKQAVRLKELGFDWYSHYSQMYYATQNYCEGSSPYSFDTIGPGDLISSPRMKEDENDGWIEDEDYCVLAPTMTQVQKWLREVKGLEVWIEVGGTRVVDMSFIPTVTMDYSIHIFDKNKFEEIEKGYIEKPTYEEALSEGINLSLTLLETKNK